MSFSKDPSILLELHAIFHGKVQGVGFRATTCRYASQLNLTATVKNYVDGSVEIYAQGKKIHLEKLVQLLQRDFFSWPF